MEECCNTLDICIASGRCRIGARQMKWKSRKLQAFELPEHTGTGKWHFTDATKRPLGFGDRNKAYVIAFCGVYFQPRQRDANDPTCEECAKKALNAHTNSGSAGHASSVGIATGRGFRIVTAGLNDSNPPSGFRASFQGTQERATAFIDISRFGRGWHTTKRIPIKRVATMRWLPPKL